MVRPACGRIAIKPVRFRDIHLAANDWFNALFAERLMKADGTEKIAVIGYGDGRHVVFCRGFGQSVVVAGAIQKAVPRMQMQMYKITHVLPIIPIQWWRAV